MLIRKLVITGKRTLSFLLFRAMWIFPLKKNRIFFQSYENADGFTDNPKYICQYLHKMFQNCFEYIFALRKTGITPNIDYIDMVRLGSIRWRFCLATAKVVVVNCGMPDWLTRRKGQLIINTWHAGGAFKNVGSRNPTARAGTEKRVNKYTNLFISSSQIFTQSNITLGMKYHGDILPCGMPRNDVLFSSEVMRFDAEKIRKQYRIGDAFCVLYAPTFRGYGQTDIKIFPPLAEIAEILKENTGRDVAVLVRKHRRDINHYDIPGVTVDVSDYPDTQELLCCADILITDYSSTIWDYALLGRPCFLFVPDLAEYDKTRGFFTPIEEWPGILCHDRDELLQEIKALDPERSRNIAEQYLEKAGSFEKGTASRTIVEYIYRKTIGREQE